MHSDTAFDDADLNGFVKTAIRAIPDALIDKALKTDDVLRRTVEKLDIATLLSNVDNPDQLSKPLQSAVTGAVKDALVQRLRDLL